MIVAMSLRIKAGSGYLRVLLLIFLFFFSLFGPKERERERERERGDVQVYDDIITQLIGSNISFRRGQAASHVSPSRRYSFVCYRRLFQLAIGGHSFIQRVAIN